MTITRKNKKHAGFTLVELMVSLGIFLVISSAIFGLLGKSQKQFRTESQVLSSFEEARLGMDQIVRDINDAGYPPANHFSTLPTTDRYASTPVAWAPSYPGAPCVIGTAGGGTCTTPGDFDVIFEGNVDGNTTTNVKWIRYKLTGITLFRAAIDKTVGGNPDTLTNANLLPYVTNVMNNAPAAQIAQFRAVYPAMFPGGVAQPIFQYNCDTAANGVQPCTSALAAGFNSPANVRDIEITLIVMTPQRDAQTNMLRLVELNGRGHRINPNQ